jgi:ABC-type multidrug transport system fused ATPase/permease subunit
MSSHRGDFFLRDADEKTVHRRARVYAACSAAVLGFDVVAAGGLLASLHGWSASGVSWRSREAWADFHGDGLDAAALALARMVLLPSLALLAVRLGCPALQGAPPRSERGLREPLLPEVSQPTPAEAVAALQASFRSDEVLKRRRALCLALLFLLCTGCSVFTGVKCVSFAAFGTGRVALLRGLLLASGAALSVVENILLAKAVDQATARSGILRPELHPHALFYTNDRSIVAHSCDCCRKRVTEGMRCGVCDFDVCLACFVRRDLAGSEGGLRGDRGLRSEGATPPTAFLMRALFLVKSEAALFMLAFFCLLATTAATLALPNFQGSILDCVFRGDLPAFKRDVLLLIVYSVASGAFGGARSLCFSLVGRRLAFEVRNMLLRAMLIQDVAFFDAATTGDLTSRLSYDVANMLSPVQTLLSSVIENAALLVGAIAACCWQSWQLTLLAATTLMPCTYVTQRYARWSSTLNRHIAAALGEGNAAATEALANIRTVRSLSTEQAEAATYEDRTRRALACGIRDAMGGSLAYALNNYLDLFTSVLILWYGGSLALSNHAAGITTGLTAGRLVTFQLYWGIFNGSFKSLQAMLASFTRAAGSAQRVLSLIDSVPDIPKSGGLVPSAPLQVDIALQGVLFVYQMRPNTPVLDNVQLSIGAGTVCALVGRSGGGKSTICHLLLRLYDPQAGRILFDGVDLRQLDLSWVHNQTGVVAQDTQLFGTSISDNIRYGCPHPCTQADVEEAAHAAHAHDFICGFAEGYDTRVGERGVRLSGGQKQRLAIARALLRRPRLLLLDEATSALDAESEAKVQAALDALIAQGGRTVVLVAHRLSTVVGADQIAVVDQGKIAECGTHDLLVRLGGVYAQLVSRQLKKQANLIEAGEDGAKADLVDALVG